MADDEKHGHKGDRDHHEHTHKDKDKRHEHTHEDEHEHDRKHEHDAESAPGSTAGAGAPGTRGVGGAPGPKVGGGTPRRGGGAPGTTGGAGGPGTRGGGSNRPGKTVGTSRGSIDGSPVTVGDITGKHPAGSWAGERKDLFLPFLFMRANPGDTGTRPVPAPFWESPDIYLLQGVLPQNAPDVPPRLGDTALAGAPNTLYAHVWNFGRSAAREVVVEFYWADPTLGISGASTHLIGQAFASLGSRYASDSHAVVKCPEPWEAKFTNGGHECLVVRVWDMSSDVLGTPEWDASLNRHVAQRNIHVIAAGDLASAPPLMVRVGPLFGAPATVMVTRAEPQAVPWLQLHTGGRGVFPALAPPTGSPTLSPPGAIGGAPPTGGAAARHQVSGDDQQVGFSTSDSPPGPGQAHVYRVSGEQGGQAVGGYTVVVVG